MLLLSFKMMIILVALFALALLLLAFNGPLVVFKQIIDTYTRQHRRTQIIYIFILYEMPSK